MLTYETTRFSRDAASQLAMGQEAHVSPDKPGNTARIGDRLGNDREVRGALAVKRCKVLVSVEHPLVRSKFADDHACFRLHHDKEPMRYAQGGNRIRVDSVSQRARRGGG